MHHDNVTAQCFVESVCEALSSSITCIPFICTMNYVTIIWDPFLQPKGEGYIAILLTKLEDADTACNKLLTEDEYKDYLANKN